MPPLVLLCLFLHSPQSPYVPVPSGTQQGLLFYECRFPMSLFGIQGPVPVQVGPTELVLVVFLSPYRSPPSSYFRFCTSLPRSSPLPILHTVLHQMPLVVGPDVISCSPTFLLVSIPQHILPTHLLSWSISPENQVLSFHLCFFLGLLFLRNYRFATKALSPFQQCHILKMPPFAKLLQDGLIDPHHPMRHISKKRMWFRKVDPMHRSYSAFSTNKVMELFSIFHHASKHAMMWSRCHDISKTCLLISATILHLFLSCWSSRS